VVVAADTHFWRTITAIVLIFGVANPLSLRFAVAVCLNSFFPAAGAGMVVTGVCTFASGVGNPLHRAGKVLPKNVGSRYAIKK